MSRRAAEWIGGVLAALFPMYNILVCLFRYRLPNERRYYALARLVGAVGMGWRPHVVDQRNAALGQTPLAGRLPGLRRFHADVDNRGAAGPRRRASASM